MTTRASTSWITTSPWLSMKSWGCSWPPGLPQTRPSSVFRELCQCHSACRVVSAAPRACQEERCDESTTAERRETTHLTRPDVSSQPAHTGLLAPISSSVYCGLGVRA